MPLARCGEDTDRGGAALRGIGFSGYSWTGQGGDGDGGGVRGGRDVEPPAPYGMGRGP